MSRSIHGAKKTGRFFDCMRNAANMCVYRGEDVEYAMHRAFAGRLQEIEK